MTVPHRPGGPPAPDPDRTRPLAGHQPPYPGPPQPPYAAPYAQQYPDPAQTWAQYPPLPSGPGRRPGPSTGKLVALIVAGVVLLGAIGGGIALLSGRGATPVDLAGPGSAARPSTEAPALPLPSGDGAVVTVALPTVIDGHQQIDNKYSRQLVDSLRRQLASTAGTGEPAVGIYGDTGDPTPAFLVAASTTDLDPELTLSGLALGMQQSAGAQQIDFQDQPAGPLGGSLRCAENGPTFTVCLWGVDGAFGINIVYGEALSRAAATTLRVRQAVEKHAN